MEGLAKQQEGYSGWAEHNNHPKEKQSSNAEPDNQVKHRPVYQQDIKSFTLLTGT